MMYNTNFVAIVKSCGKILRERGSDVFLPFGSEYSILFKNLNSERAVVRVQIDGEDVLSGNRLVIPANQQHELKGFMKGSSVRNRFKFIEKTKEISSYRGDRIDDGIIRIEYQFELPKHHYLSYVYSPEIITRSLDTVYNSCIGESYKSHQTKSLDGITVKGTPVKETYTGVSVSELGPVNIIILNLKGADASTTKYIKTPLLVKSKITCQTCGRKHKSNNKFCSNCGTCLV